MQKETAYYDLGMPNREYRNNPALNYSHLKLMFKPALYKKMVLDGEKKEQTSNLSIGTAVHTLILEPHLKHHIRKLSDYGFTDRRKHAAIKQLQHDNPEDLFFSDSEMEAIQAMVSSVKGHDEAFKLYTGRISNEVSFFWHDEAYNFACKGRADTINFDEGYVVDLKTTKDAAGFMKECVNFGYHLQAAFYLQGLKKIVGRDLDWYWVAVDSATYETYVYKMTATTLKVGDIEVETLKSKLRECVDTDTWPSGNEAVLDGELPSWYTARVLKKVEGDNYNEFRAT